MSSIQYPDDTANTGPLVETDPHVVGGDTVHRFVHVTARTATATLANVTGATSSATLAAANTARRGLVVYNDSTATLFIKYGVTASSSSFTEKVGPDMPWHMPDPIYTGRIDGIWDAVNGAARVTELTD